MMVKKSVINVGAGITTLAQGGIDTGGKFGLALVVDEMEANTLLA